MENFTSDKKLREAAEAFRKTKSYGKSAELLGIPKTTAYDRIKKAAEKGLFSFDPIIPTFRVSQVTTDAKGRTSIQQKPEHGDKFEVPQGHSIKGVSALIDESGQEIVKWIKTKNDSNHINIVESLQEAFKNYENIYSPVSKPDHTIDSLLTLIPVNDLHLNMLCWSREVGENWDLKIAERKIGEAFDDVISRSPPSSRCIILGGGDLIHADTNENRTAKSGNILDADGRHQKSLEAAHRLKVKIIDAALSKHGSVLVRVLKGNHDEYSSVAITYFLKAYYRNEPRVEIDTDASLFFYHRFGSVMIAATHGHTVGMNKMPSIMAHRRAEDWGKTKFRYCHGFHIHHYSKIATEGSGVICESHQAPIPQDAWHHESGYLSGRSVQTIQYHSRYGEIGRVRVAIIEDVDKSDDYL